MRIKNILVSLLCIFALVGSIQAQENSKRDRIKSLRTGFFTQQLELSSADAEKFWPIYNQYDESLYNLRHKERTQIWKVIREKGHQLTVEKAEELLHTLQELRKEETLLKEEVEKKLLETFNAKMVLLVKKTEYNFHKHLLESVKE